MREVGSSSIQKESAIEHPGPRARSKAAVKLEQIMTSRALGEMITPPTGTTATTTSHGFFYSCPATVLIGNFETLNGG